MTYIEYVIFLKQNSVLYIRFFPKKKRVLKNMLQQKMAYH